MKNMQRISRVILATTVLAGCTKEGAEEQIASGGTRQMTITAEYTQAESTTRTVLDGTQVKWLQADQLGIFATVNSTTTVAENAAFAIPTGGINALTGVAQFSGSYTYSGEPPTSVDYYAYTPYATTAGTNAAALALTLPATQYPTATSFDSAADFLFGIPVHTSGEAIGEMSGGADLSFIFERPFAIGSFKFTQIPAAVVDPANETVRSLTLTFATSGIVAGAFTADITTAATLPSLTGAAKSITLDYTGKNITLDDFTAYWIMNPVAITGFTAVIETTGCTITKNFSDAALLFKKNTILKSTDVQLGGATVDIAYGNTLVNTTAPFATTGAPVSYYSGSDVYLATGWNVTPNLATVGNVRTDVAYHFAILGGTEAYSAITNGKIWQTLRLEAGTYQFTVTKDGGGDVRDSQVYAVAALGSTLPDVAGVSVALGSYQYPTWSSSYPNAGTFDFVLAQEEVVSLGFVVTIPVYSYLRIVSIDLTKL